MQTVSHPALREPVLWGTLDGGLTLVLYPRHKAPRMYAQLTLDYGSIDRTFALETAPGQAYETPAGVAHFLEHRIFDKDSGDISARFADLGVTVDAHTTVAETGYSITCSDRFEEALSLLFELVFVPFFTEEGTERERAIIMRELELYQDDADWVSFFSGLQALYGDHPIAADIAGTPQSLERIDSRVLSRCYEAFYQPQRMVLFVFGDFEAAAMQARVEVLLAGARSGSAPRAIPERPTAVPQPARLERAMSIAEPRLALAFHDDSSPHGEELIRRELNLELVLDILFGPASAFYTREYGAGLIEEESFSWEVQAEPGYCFCLVSGDCSEPRLLEERVMAEIERASREEAIAQDWRRATRKMYGSLISRFEDGQDCADVVGTAVRRGCRPFDFLPILSSVTVEDAVDALHTVLQPLRCGVSTLIPRG